MIMMFMFMYMLILTFSTLPPSWLIALLTLIKKGESSSAFVDGYVPMPMPMPIPMPLKTRNRKMPVSRTRTCIYKSRHRWKLKSKQNRNSSNLKLFPFKLVDDRFKGCPNSDTSICMASSASSDAMDRDMDRDMDKSTGKSMATSIWSKAIVESKGRIETVQEEDLNSSDISRDRDSDHNHNHDGRNWTQRLAAYLISEQKEIVQDQKIAIVIGSYSYSCINMPMHGSNDTASKSKPQATPPSPLQHPLSWIGSLVGQLGASSVHFILSPEEEQEEAPTPTLTLAQKNNKNIEPFISHYSENDLNLKLLQKCKVMDSAEFDDIGDGNIDIIILSTTNPHVINEDPFINDFLRRTDTPIYMSEDFVDEFCYHFRIQEGANITLW